MRLKSANTWELIRSAKLLHHAGHHDLAAKLQVTAHELADIRARGAHEKAIAGAIRFAVEAVRQSHLRTWRRNEDLLMAQGACRGIGDAVRVLEAHDDAARVAVLGLGAEYKSRVEQLTISARMAAMEEAECRDSANLLDTIVEAVRDAVREAVQLTDSSLDDAMTGMNGSELSSTPERSGFWQTLFGKTAHRPIVAAGEGERGEAAKL